jgi:O-antigen/teichoic acid export membrane protein
MRPGISLRVGRAAGSVLHGSSIYLASNILSAAIPFFLLPVLTRYLSPAEYGEIAMFQTLVGGLGAVIGLGTAGLVSRKYFEEGVGNEELARLVAACLQLAIVSCFGVATALLMFNTSMSEWLGLKLEWMLCAVFVSAAAIPIQLRLAQWEVRKRAVQYGALQNFQSIMNVGLSLLFVVVMLRGASGRIWAQILTVGIVALVALALLHRDRLLKFVVWNPPALREALSFGVPLMPHLAGAFIVAAVDRFLVTKELGLEEAGIYMVAVQLAGALLMVFDAISRAFTPWLFERLNNASAAVRSHVVMRVYGLFLLMASCGVLAFTAGGWFVELIAGPKYARAGEVVGWLAIGQVFFGMYFVLAGFLFYTKRTGVLSWITVLSGAVGIVLLVVGIRALGLRGAAMAFCITMAFRLALTWWAAQRCHPMPWLAFAQGPRS